MLADRFLTTIDFHTGGIGMRLLTAGVPRSPGATILDKRTYFAQHFDDLRTGLCFAPRGHGDLVIAVLVDPVSPGAHFGLFFMHAGGYYMSCGEATIGAATIAVSTGLVPRTGEETRVIIDTEAGPVETIAHGDRDRVRAVTIRWRPALVLRTRETVKLQDLGELAIDVATGTSQFLFDPDDSLRRGLSP